MPLLNDPTTLLISPFLLAMLVFFSAMVKYVFPPYWGDSAILLGFFFASRDGVAPAWLFASGFIGAMLGAALAFAIGRRYGVVVIRKLTRPSQLQAHRRLRELFERFGERVLVANRFLPVVRGFMLFGAGALRLRFGVSMAYTAASNVVWIGVLMATGMLTAGSWEQLQQTFRHYSRLSGLVAATIVAVWIAAILWRARQTASIRELEPHGGCGKLPT